MLHHNMLHLYLNNKELRGYHKLIKIRIFVCFETFGRLSSCLELSVVFYALESVRVRVWARFEAVWVELVQTEPNRTKPAEPNRTRPSLTQLFSLTFSLSSHPRPSFPAPAPARDRAVRPAPAGAPPLSTSPECGHGPHHPSPPLTALFLAPDRAARARLRLPAELDLRRRSPIAVAGDLLGPSPRR